MSLCVISSLFCFNSRRWRQNRQLNGEDDAAAALEVPSPPLLNPRVRWLGWLNWPVSSPPSSTPVKKVTTGILATDDSLNVSGGDGCGFNQSNTMGDDTSLEALFDTTLTLRSTSEPMIALTPPPLHLQSTNTNSIIRITGERVDTVSPLAGIRVKTGLEAAEEVDAIDTLAQRSDSNELMQSKRREISLDENGGDDGSATDRSKRPEEKNDNDDGTIPQRLEDDDAVDNNAQRFDFSDRKQSKPHEISSDEDSKDDNAAEVALDDDHQTNKHGNIDDLESFVSAKRFSPADQERDAINVVPMTINGSANHFEDDESFFTARDATTGSVPIVSPDGVAVAAASRTTTATTTTCSTTTTTTTTITTTVIAAAHGETHPILISDDEQSTVEASPTTDDSLSLSFETAQPWPRDNEDGGAHDMAPVQLFPVARQTPPHSTATVAATATITNKVTTANHNDRHFTTPPEAQSRPPVVGDRVIIIGETRTGQMGTVRKLNPKTFRVGFDGPDAPSSNFAKHNVKLVPIGLFPSTPSDNDAASPASPHNLNCITPTRSLDAHGQPLAVGDQVLVLGNRTYKGKTATVQSFTDHRVAVRLDGPDESSHKFAPYNLILWQTSTQPNGSGSGGDSNASGGESELRQQCPPCLQPLANVSSTPNMMASVAVTPG